MKSGGGSVTLGDHMPSNFIQVGVVAPNKREPLLPTPPSHQIVKLDTSLTCEYHILLYVVLSLSLSLMPMLLYSGGVPLNVMEVIDFPKEGSPEKPQALQVGPMQHVQAHAAGSFLPDSK